MLVLIGTHVQGFFHGTDVMTNIAAASFSLENGDIKLKTRPSDQVIPEVKIM